LLISKNRPASVTVANTLQLLLGLIYAGTLIYLFYLMRTPKIRQSPDALADLEGLTLAVCYLAPVALLTLFGAYGMWKNKRWGWLVSFVANFCVAAVFVYSLIDEGWHAADATSITFAAGSLLALIPLLLPPVWKHFWRKPGSAQQPTAAELP
jgi:uncharacterized membrane protein (DUF2068 family)